jgi:hypothetical protein
MFVIVVALIVIAARPDALSAQRSTDGVRTPVARSATPTTERSGQEAPGAPTRLSADQRLTLVRAADLDVGSISSELRLTPRAPYDANGEISVIGFSNPGAPPAEGVMLVNSGLENAFGDQSQVSTRFRTLHVGRPILVDFVARVATMTAQIKLQGSGILEHRTLKGGDQHITAIIVPSTPGWYGLNLVMEETGAIWIYAVEITVLD